LIGRDRQLERELAEARELIAIKDQSLQAASATIHMNNTLMSQGSQRIDELREQRDRLAEALRNLKNASIKYKMDEDDLEIDDANSAIASITPKPPQP
jgi:DNA-binding transcriptional MerR regulator